MHGLLGVVLPVFLLIGVGYLARWRRLFDDDAVEVLMRFAQGFALPVLLFRAIAGMDLGQSYDLPVLASFCAGSSAGFVLGLLGGRLLFARPWEDSIAFGFSAMFSNSLLMGVPITEQAYGADALAANFAIISLHSPFCYLVGITAIEVVRGQGGSLLQTLGNVGRGMARSPLVVGIALGFVVNLGHVPVPAAVDAALALVAATGLPVALFALGGVLFRYRPEGDMRAILYVCGLSLLLHPLITWSLGQGFGLGQTPLRSAVLTGAMPPGVNSYLFASIYGVARRVAASSLLIGTALSLLTIWAWLAILP